MIADVLPAQGAAPSGPPPASPLITTRAAALWLGVSTKTIRTWFNTGYIQGERVTPSLILITRTSIEEPLNRLPPLPAR